MEEEVGAFERVYTMTDFYDGPRGGIADYRGAPHLYASMFDDDDTFELQPVDAETLALALEDWAIWLRWEEAFKDGLVTIASHPALPEERARHDEIKPLLAARLAALPDPIRAIAEFRAAPGHGHLEVRWT